MRTSGRGAALRRNRTRRSKVARFLRRAEFELHGTFILVFLQLYIPSIATMSMPPPVQEHKSQSYDSANPEAPVFRLIHELRAADATGPLGFHRQSSHRRSRAGPSVPLPVQGGTVDQRLRGRRGGETPRSHCPLAKSSAHCLRRAQVLALCAWPRILASLAGVTAVTLHKRNPSGLPSVTVTPRKPFPAQSSWEHERR